MKNKKRWLAGLLAMILIMNTFVGSALAKNEDEVSTEVTTEQRTTEVSTETAEKTEEKATEQSTEKQNTEVSTEKKEEATVTKKVAKVRQQSEESNIAVINENAPDFLKEDAFKTMVKQVYGETISLTADDIVYVAGSSNGQEGQGNKGCYTNPYITLSSAISNTSGNVVYVLIDATQANEKYAAAGYGIRIENYQGKDEKGSYDDWVVSQNRPAIIVSENSDDAYLKMDKEGWSLKNSVGFYGVDLKLSNGTNPVELYCNGYTAVFGGEGKNNFRVKQTSGDYYPVLFGGSSVSTVASTDVTVNGGTWSQIYSAGSFDGKGNVSDVTGVAKLVVNGKIDSSDECSVKNGYVSGAIASRYYNAAFINGGAAGSLSNNASIHKTKTEVKNINDSKISVVITNGDMGTAWQEGDDPNLLVTNCDNITIKRGIGHVKSFYCKIKDSNVKSFSLEARENIKFIEWNTNVIVTAENTVFDDFTGEKVGGSTEEVSIKRSEDWSFKKCTFKKSLLLSPEYGRLNYQNIVLDNSTFPVGCKVNFSEESSGKFKIIGEDQTVKVVKNQKNITETNVIPIIDNKERTYSIDKAKLDLSEIDGKVLIETTTEDSQIICGAKSKDYQIPQFDSNAKLVLAQDVKITINECDTESKMIKVQNSDIYDEDTYSCIEIVQPNLQGKEVQPASGCEYKISPKLFTSKAYYYLASKELNTEGDNYIYVDQKQENYDENISDGTAEKPFKSLEEAFKKVSSSQCKIVLLEDYIIEQNTNFPKLTDQQISDLKESSEIVEITSKDGIESYGASIIFAGKNRAINLYNDLKFDDVSFTNDQEATNTLYVNGNHLEIGQNVSTTKYQKRYIHLNAGTEDGSPVDKISMDIQSGYWEYIYDGKKSTSVGNKDAQGEVAEKINISGSANFYVYSMYNTVYGKTEITVNDKNSYLTDSTSVYIEGTYYGQLTGNFNPQTRFNNTTVKPTAYEYVDLQFQSKSGFRPEYSSHFGGTYKKGGNITYKGKMHNFYVTGGTDISEADVSLEMTTPQKLEIGQTVLNQNTKNLVVNINEYQNIFSILGPDDTLPKNVVIDFKNGNYTLNRVKNAGTLRVESDAVLGVQKDVTCNAVEAAKDATVNFMGKLILGIAESNDATLSIESNAKMIVKDLFKLYGKIQGSSEENSAGMLYLNGKVSADQENDCEITGSATGYVYVETTEQYDDSVLKGQRIYVTDKNVADHLKVKNTEQDNDLELKLISESAPFILYGHKQAHNYIYLDGTNGDDDNSGKTSKYPVKTLDRAYDLVPDEGTIVVIGDTTITAWPKSGSQSVHITGYDTNPYLSSEDTKDYTDKVFTLKGDLLLNGNVALECLNATANDATLYPNGYELSVGVSKNNTQYPSDKNFINTGTLNITGWHSSYYGSGGERTKIKVYSGKINKIDVIYGINLGISIDAANRVLEEITVEGGTIDSLNLMQQMNVRGTVNYYLSGGKINNFNLAYPGGYDRSYDSMINNLHISDKFKFGTINLKHRGTYNVFIKDWDPEWDDTESHGKIDVTDPYTTSYKVPRSVNITIQNSELEELACGGHTSRINNKTDVVTLNLLDGAKIQNLYGGGVKGASNGCTTKQLNVNILDKNASIEHYYASKEGVNSKADQVVFNVQTGDTYLLDGIDAQNGDIDELNVWSKNNKGSSVILSQSAKDKFTNVNVSAGNGLYMPTNAVIKGNYTGAAEENTPSLLYMPNAATTTINGKVSGYSTLLSGAVKGNALTEEKTGFKNGLKINTQFIDNINATKAFSLPTEYQQTLITPSNDALYWSIPDSEDTIWRNHIYVGGENAAEGNDGTYVRPVNSIAEAYIKAAQAYNMMMEKKDDSDTDKDTKAKIENSLKEGMVIVVNGEVGLGDIHAACSNTHIVKAEQNNIPDITIQRDTENGTILLSSNENQYELPLDTKLENVYLCSNTSKRSAIYANGKTLIMGEAVTTNHSNRTPIDVYGGSMNDDISKVNLELDGGTFGNVYGGNARKSIDGNVKVNLAGTVKIDNFYGGNQTGSIKGNINVAIDQNSDIGRFYGGGNNAPIDGNIYINFISGTIGQMYGGGENSTATATKAFIDIGVEETDTSRKACIKSLYRGAGYMAGYTSEEGVKTTLGKNAVLGSEDTKKTTQFCAGGYSGNVTKTELEINGATIYGNLYAGGWGEAGSEKYGNVGAGGTTITMNKGTIYGNLYGGGNNGVVNGTSTLYLKSGNISDDIYGGGNAAAVTTSKLQIDGDITAQNIYGGSYNITADSKDIQETSEICVNSLVKKDNRIAIFGGSNMNGNITDNVNVIIKGKADADIYGGGDQAALKITPIVTVKENAELTGNVYGGGKGKLKTEAKIQRAFLKVFTGNDLIDANVPSTNVTINGTVTGDIFAGGEYATVGTTNESADETELSKKVSNVTIAGKVNGKVYGGGKGEKDKNYAAINGSTNVTLATGGNVTVSTNAENAKTGVTFGGGQNAPVAGDTNVNVTDGTYSTIFGGNDVSGEIQGKTNVNITGAKTEHAYGAGRDAKYEGTSATVTVNDQTDQPANSKPAISEVYGGGYGEGAQTAKADVAIQNGTVTTAYAGGNAASTKDTEISVTGGHADTVFGGGNAATITGSSKVTVNTTDNTQHADTVFAGNNKAAMAIKPTFDFKSGKIGTVYCGGNQGIMTYKSDANSGISYNFDYPKAEIKTVFAGCNNTTETTSDVQLTLVSGTYDTIYGGNNQNGAMNHTSVITDASKDSTKAFHVDTIYGGGNQADAVNTSVTLKNGTVKTVYAGGNAATATQSATINTDGQTSNDNMKVTDLYCGNNEAAMAIDPNIDLAKAEITSFYGGGNQGAMTAPNGITYTFDSDDLTIDTIYGGGNEAGVTKSATLNVKKGNYTNIYGGSNSKGTVDTANVNIQGNVGRQDKTDAKIFGGGRGRSTIVNNANVSLQNGTIAGNVYGGSGFGTVGTAKVSAEEASNGIVKVLGNIYGAGYGVTSSADDTQVDVNLKLSMGKDDASKDLNITEILKSTDSTDKSGESKASATWKTTYKDGSYIAGNVFGGGDMGQVGQGYINASTNTAVIEKGGKTSVNVKNGYINGNIFGGGNGQPGGEDESGNKITEYTVYMGTVFGTSNVNMTGGYVNGNIFGCGQQSRTYAAADQNNDNQKDASYVNITTDNNTPILIGGSIFGGGNKGNGTTQNASVATVYGDTHVELQGVKGQYTQIYLLSNGTSGGGVYGDGNLCLVSGKKYVTLRDFSCGTQNSVKLLKTFYSLQRADVVDIIASRIVLKGAVDLVAENADDTAYSVNRVSQLNLKDSSTLKVTKTVNLLGELTSDEQTNRQFIDRGNNNGNAHVGNDYTKHGGKNPTEPLTESDVNDYINAYNSYTQNGSIQAASSYQSINVVCVANGGYLEVKKSAKEYGPVTGLFTLELVNANPGEGGGFVYADIMGKQMNGQYVTGNFVCVTKQAENSEDYMYAYHNVGGQLSDDGKYEYYLWYLKGNKYSYDVDLTSYIGTKDTEFTKTISLSVEPEYCFVLTELNQTKELSTINLNKMYQNTWSKSKEDSEKFAVEVTLIKKSKSGNNITTNAKSIGYIGYQTTSNTNPEASAKKDGNGKLVWGIWRSDGNGGWKFQACKGNENSFKVESEDALAQIDSNVVNAQLKFTLHKGTGMTTEFRNLPFEIKIAEAKQTDYDRAVTDRSYIQEDSCIRLTTNLNLSAIRLVPTQAAYMGSGRMFAGVSSSSNVNITKTSAFTAQFVTKYIPSAFNTGSTNQIKETLTTSYSDTYLLDENGVGYTVKDLADGTVRVLNVVNSSDPNVKTYDVTKSGDTYRVSYRGQDGNILTKEDGTDKTYSCEVKKQSSGFTLPKGTMITLLASLDEQNPTYWYYYCTEDTTDVKLEDFKKMNTSNTSSSQSGDSVYDTIYTTSSSRVTENMIFVFNFEKVSDSDWNKVSALEGNLQLKHTYNSSVYDSVDIMDYVSAESETSGGTTTISYNREMPRQTDAFKISRDSDGITKFSIENADQSSTYGQKDDMKFRLDITPDTNVTNTQYEEREYAVILKLKDKTSGKEIAFPEGTVFHYNGKQLATGKDNKYVIVPVSTVGSHEVEIASKLEGFDVNQYELIAALYSTSEDGYYNSIKVSNNTDDQTSAGFTVKADPVYALKVTENSASSGDRKKNHFISAGETFKFEVKAKGGESNDAVSIGLYQYNNGKYKKVTLSTILEDNAILKTGTGNWTPKVQEGASKGTYRLEFTYHDKTEYWDFMVR